MGVRCEIMGSARRNRIGSSTPGRASRVDWAAALAREGTFFLPGRHGGSVKSNGRAAVGVGFGRTDVERVVRDYKLEPAAREI